MTLADNALDYAVRVRWEVFPLRGKVPVIPAAHPPGDPGHGRCHGECGADGHGVLDATRDGERVAGWWRRWVAANIGGRVPPGLVVVDVDPRHGGDDTWRALEAEHGPIDTRQVLSGRGDGGRHVFLRHPGGELKATIGAGLDVKTHAGYTLLPPSLHPDSGRPYTWVDPALPFAVAPGWLVNLLRKPAPTPPKRSAPLSSSSDSPADWYTATHTWGDVLGVHGWTIVAGDGETDGSSWRHPAATARWSATIRHGLLFVYSTSTAFDPTTAADPHGYTRFAAWAVLDHGGDQSAAARAVRAVRGAL